MFTDHVFRNILTEKAAFGTAKKAIYRYNLMGKVMLIWLMIRESLFWFSGNCINTINQMFSLETGELRQTEEISRTTDKNLRMKERLLTKMVSRKKKPSSYTGKRIIRNRP